MISRWIIEVVEGGAERAVPSNSRGTWLAHPHRGEEGYTGLGDTANRTASFNIGRDSGRTTLRCRRAR
jgi:hypothetical protein